MNFHYRKELFYCNRRTQKSIWNSRPFIPSNALLMLELYKFVTLTQLTNSYIRFFWLFSSWLFWYLIKITEFTSRTDFFRWRIRVILTIGFLTERTCFNHSPQWQHYRISNFYPSSSWSSKYIVDITSRRPLTWENWIIIDFMQWQYLCFRPFWSRTLFSLFFRRLTPSLSTKVKSTWKLKMRAFENSENSLS